MQSTGMSRSRTARIFHVGHRFGSTDGPQDEFSGGGSIRQKRGFRHGGARRRGPRVNVWACSQGSEYFSLTGEVVSWRKCPEASGGVRNNDEMLQDLMVGVLATKSSWQRLRSGLQGFVLVTSLPALSGIPFLSFPFG